MKKPRQQPGEPVRWGVYVLRGKGKRLGTVDAKDIEEALEIACKLFQITDEDRWRLSAQRERSAP